MANEIEVRPQRELNLQDDFRMTLDRPVTVTELQAVKQEQVGSNRNEETEIIATQDGVKLVADFSRSKRRGKKKNGSRKKKERQEREQDAQNGKTRKYAKEMRNREIVRKKAVDLKKKAALTPSVFDDRVAIAAINGSRSFDSLIYGNFPSDVGDNFDDIADKVLDTDKS
mgnify:CR=1 FL=1